MILVAGSVHMDVLSRIESEDDVIDSPGSVNISIGGSAGNVAMNLAVIGEPVRLLSAMNDSAYSRIIKTHLTVLGVDPFIVTRQELPLSAFVAHINRHGEIRSAVSSMPVERYLFPLDVIDSALDGIDVLILECNLSTENMIALFDRARQKDVPVYVGTVSEAKAVRALALMSAEENSRVAGVFCNEQEGFRMLSLSGCSSFERLSENLGPLIVTMGADGAFVYRNGKCNVVANENDPITDAGTGNFLGAGDLLMSETIRLLVRGKDLEDAVLSGILRAREVIHLAHCNLAGNDAMERIITQAQTQSQSDNLTGLSNRASMLTSFQSVISRNKRNKRPLSLILLDLDRFKMINDTLGHDVGDMVLKGVAGVLMTVFRGSDIVGRWGGEEFLVLMPETDLSSAAEAGERLRDHLGKSKFPCTVTVSGGIVEVDYLNETLFDAVKRADLLLYKAKHRGRNQLLSEA